MKRFNWQFNLLMLALLAGILYFAAPRVRRILQSDQQTELAQVQTVQEQPATVEPTPIYVEIGETPTPIPTWTPRPTPSPRPGPTDTPFPIVAPEPNPSGTIYFITIDQENKSSLNQVGIDSDGNKATEPIPFPVPLDFEVSDVIPSPDGNYVVLMQPAMPGGIPYVFDLQTQKVWPLFPEYPDLPGIVFGWHPDSQKVLFWSLDAALWLIDVKSGSAITLNVIDGPVQGAAISPDGQQVVYIAKSEKFANTLWKVSTAGGDAKPLLDFESDARIFGWSSTGEMILHMGRPRVSTASEQNSGNQGILWLVDPNGEGSKNLSGPFLSGWGYEPMWSPDGQSIAFVGLDEGAQYGCTQTDPPPDWNTCQFRGTAIYVTNILTQEVKRITSGINPVWSPDGSRLAFFSDQSGSSEIWVFKFAGNNFQQLTADSEVKSQIAWTKSGR